MLEALWLRSPPPVHAFPVRVQRPWHDVFPLLLWRDACLLRQKGFAEAGETDPAAYAGTVRHEETGLLVPNTTEAWVDALSRLVEDADLRAKIGAAGRRYLYAERTLAASGHRWIEAIDALLEG